MAVVSDIRHTAILVTVIGRMYSIQGYGEPRISPQIEQDIICNFSVKSTALKGAPRVHLHQVRVKALVLTKSFVDFVSPMTDRIPEMINCSDKRKMLSGQFLCTK